MKTETCTNYKAIGTGECWNCGHTFNEHYVKLHYSTKHTPGPWHLSGTENPDVVGPFVPRQNGGIAISEVPPSQRHEVKQASAQARDRYAKVKHEN